MAVGHHRTRTVSLDSPFHQCSIIRDFTICVSVSSWNMTAYNYSRFKNPASTASLALDTLKTQHETKQRPRGGQRHQMLRSDLLMSTRETSIAQPATLSPLTRSFLGRIRLVPPHSTGAFAAGFFGGPGVHRLLVFQRGVKAAFLSRLNSHHEAKGPSMCVRCVSSVQLL